MKRGHNSCSVTVQNGAMAGSCSWKAAQLHLRLVADGGGGYCSVAGNMFDM